MLALDRPQLLAQITESVERSRVTLLCAPAGYGKTTAVARWLSGRDEQSLWIGCAAANAETLWKYVAQRLALTLDVEIPTPDFPLSSVRELIAAVDRPLVLVFDDYHHTTTPENDQLIAELADGNRLVTFIVLARRVRVLNGPLVTSRTPVRVFGPRDLAFSSEEAEELAAMHGLRDDGRLRAAMRDAAGWPLATRAALGPARAIDEDGTGSGSAAADRAESIDPRVELSRFALNHLEIVSDTGRRTLLAASLLDGISFGLLERFTGVAGPRLRETVHQLLELGVLTSVSDGAGTEFHCHPAVRPAFALRSERSLSHEERVGLLGGRAAELDHVAPFSAFKLYCAVSDHDRAETLLVRSFVTLTDEAEEILPYLRGLPESVLVAHPAYVSARLFLETGDPSVPSSTLARLFELLRAGVRTRLAEPRSATPDGIAADLPVEHRLATIAQHMALCRLAGDLDAAYDGARELEARIASAHGAEGGEAALAEPPGSTPTPGAAPIYYREIALTALGAGDLEGARRNWEQLLAHAEAVLERPPGDHSRDTARTVTDTVSGQRWRLAALNGLAFTEMMEGRMTRCAELLAECDAFSEATGAAAPASTWVVGEIARAHLAYESADETLLRRALERLTPLRDRVEAWPMLLIGEAEVVRSQRGVEWAMAQMQAMLDRDGQNPRHRTRMWHQCIGVYRAMLSTALGDLAGAGQLLASLDPDEPGTRLERARLALFALDDMQALLQVQQISGAVTVRQQANRTLITAVAAWGCGRVQEAIDALAAATELIREHTLTSLLWGLPYESLRSLAEAARDAGACDLLPEIDAVPAAARCRRYERLTEMELRTLEAVAVHRSIGSTAEALFVTSATVKKHLNAVYRKLQSRGREEAILQATRMGLLSPAAAD
ncbi:hypothetical protein [Leucobacter sp.]